MFINIEVERLRRYMSRADMAKALAINVDTLNDWITKRRAIPAEGLRALVRLFEGCSLDYLLKEGRERPVGRVEKGMLCKTKK